jgi:hypothetical protein
VAKNDSSTSLWEKRKEKDVASPKQGPYADRRSQLLAALIKAKQFGLLKEISANTYEIRYRKNLLQSYATIDLQVDFRTKKLQIAMNVDKDHGDDVRYYNLTDSGYAVNLDGLSSEEEVWPYLEAGINASLRDLQKEIDHQIGLKQERRRASIRNLIICAVALVVAVLAFFCIRWWMFEPQEAANRARIAYDASNHQIDSAGYPVDAHALAGVPSGTLQSIPSYGGDDNTLTHPRMISISYNSSSNWCSNVTVDIPSGSALVVAAENDSLFIHDRYVATYTNRTLTVCLVDGFVKNEASKNVAAKLALQVKPQGATN